ncbi:MAG TPA: VWA domain-containing protein [Anaerolineae bacterium]|nr:VWA domain-containing protein [Anaerolineae bacterium]
MQQLQDAMTNLTGIDNSLTGRFSRFRSREKITIITFNHEVQAITTFEIGDPSTQSADMAAVRDYVNNLQAGGETAIYTALTEAYTLAADAFATDPDRYYSVVLMSDGRNTAGVHQAQFNQFYQSLREGPQQIRTFSILFGNAEEDDMQAIATTTRGRMFDGRSTTLSTIFKEIRGYQ